MRKLAPGVLLTGRMLALAGPMALVSLPAAAEGGLPQLRFADYPAQIVWLVISFVVLYALLKAAVLPRLTGTIETRAGKISGDLDAAVQAKAEAEAAIAGYEKALAGARDRANALAAERRAEVQAEIDARKAEIDATIAAETKAAEASIRATKAAAMADLRFVSPQAAVFALQKIAGLEIDRLEAKQVVVHLLGRDR